MNFGQKKKYKSTTSNNNNSNKTVLEANTYQEEIKTGRKECGRGHD